MPPISGLCSNQSPKGVNLRRQVIDYIKKDLADGFLDNSYVIQSGEALHQNQTGYFAGNVATAIKELRTEAGCGDAMTHRQIYDEILRLTCDSDESGTAGKKFIKLNDADLGGLLDCSGTKQSAYPTQDLTTFADPAARVSFMTNKQTPPATATSVVSKGDAVNQLSTDANGLFVSANSQYETALTKIGDEKIKGLDTAYETFKQAVAKKEAAEQASREFDGAYPGEMTKLNPKNETPLPAEAQKAFDAKKQKDTELGKLAPLETALKPKLAQNLLDAHLGVAEGQIVDIKRHYDNAQKAYDGHPGDRPNPARSADLRAQGLAAFGEAEKLYANKFTPEKNKVSTLYGDLMASVPDGAKRNINDRGTAMGQQFTKLDPAYSDNAQLKQNLTAIDPYIVADKRVSVYCGEITDKTKNNMEGVDFDAIRKIAADGHLNAEGLDCVNNRIANKSFKSESGDGRLGDRKLSSNIIDDLADYKMTYNFLNAPESKQKLANWWISSFAENGTTADEDALKDFLKTTFGYDKESLKALKI